MPKLARPVEFRGRTQSMSEWSRELGLPYHVIVDRLNDGWTPEQALTSPVGTRRASLGKLAAAADLQRLNQALPEFPGKERVAVGPGLAKKTDVQERLRTALAKLGEEPARPRARRSTLVAPSPSSRAASRRALSPRRWSSPE